MGIPGYDSEAERLLAQAKGAFGPFNSPAFERAALTAILRNKAALEQLQPRTPAFAQR